MNKSLKLLLSLTAVLLCFGTSAQERVSSNTNDLAAFSEVKSISDVNNDRFLSYYRIEIKNTSDVTKVFTVQMKYAVNGEKKMTDESETITLAPGETIRGHRVDLNELTLFKEFNVGNSGKKASDKEVSLLSLKFNIK